MTDCPDALTLIDSFRGGTRSPRESLHERIRRIDERNEALVALREVARDQAARRADYLVREGAVQALLYGVPVVIKDNVAQAGCPNRAGRKDEAGPPAKADAAIVQRLDRAGAIVLARANMDELAYGVTGENPHTGQVRNPWNEKRHPGGSSAGAAVAVASGMVPLAVGTDTAGSVRIPAALCGVVGMCPTHGAVPARGIAPLAPSLDTAGAIGRTVADVAVLASVLTDQPALATAKDSGSVDVSSLRLTALSGAFAVDVDDGVEACFDRAAGLLRECVAAVRREAIPDLAGAPRASGPIIGAEASHAWQQEFEAHPDWFGEEVTGHLARGAAIKAVRYLRAQDERSIVVQAIDRALAESDLLVLPTTATVATPAGAPGPQLQFLGLTVPFSLGGYPSITVPMGRVDGMPAGLQVVGRRGQDAVVIALAAAFEREFPGQPDSSS